jgi:hypothetical protein
MALMKGTKLVEKPKKPKKIRKEDDPISLYLKDEWLSLANRFSPFFHFLFKSIYFGILISWPIILLFQVMLYQEGDISGYPFVVVPMIFGISYYLALKKITIEGKLRYLMTDGFSWFQTGRLLSPKNPSPGLKVQGTQLITSRYLIVPGPESSYSGFTKKIIPGFLFLLLVPFALAAAFQAEYHYQYIVFVDHTFHVYLTVVWFFASSAYFIWSMGKPLYQPRRFFIFDRKKQTLSYHPAFLSRRMLTRPWVEFEGRAVWEQRAGYSCKLIHAPTGQLLELQGPDLHWNNAGAVEAYSYVARFMDLSQSLPNKPEFERYFPEDKELALISDKDARIRHLFSKHDEREERRAKYQNPPADVVFGNIKTFDFLVKDHPWLSAKNVWNAAHKYNREPNWDKWVRDKWGLAANEDYQVPEDEKEGEPEWFDKFYAFLKANRRKIKPMDDESRIQFTQDWFEGTFPEQHWVDPVTADSYDLEEEFA